MLEILMYLSLVKGDGKLTYHLGADYFEDPDGFNFMSPKWTRTKLIFVVTPPQEAQ